MSQRTISYNDLEAFCGWDRPLQRFFLVIERQGATDDDPNNGYIFNNLARPNPGMTLTEIKAELDKALIPVPPTLFKDLEEDEKLNRGNHGASYVFTKDPLPHYEAKP